MSEESPAAPSPGAAPPAAQTSDAASPDAPSPGPASWSRRKPLVIGFGAGILVAAVIAVVVLVIAGPGGGSQPLTYTTLPAACDTISAASLAKYLPEGSSNPQSRASSTADQEGACIWSSITGGQDRTLLVQLDVYGSAAGLAKAEQAYRRNVFAPSCCKNLTVSRRSVSGLGDQAVALFITVKPDTSGATAPPPGVSLTVRSGNAYVNLVYTIFPIGSARPALTPDAELAGTIAMARNVLAALAHPAAAASAATAPAASSAAAPGASPAGPPTASPSPQGLRYVSPHDACTLVKASTLAPYAPGATQNKMPEPTSTLPGEPRLSNCAWGALDASIFLQITIGPDSPTAQQDYEFAVQYAEHASGTGTTFQGAQPVRGVGQQATAVFGTMSANSPSVALYVWSGNAQFQVSFTDLGLGTPTSRATKLAADIAVARDVLAALPT